MTKQKRLQKKPKTLSKILKDKRVIFLSLIILFLFEIFLLPYFVKAAPTPVGDPSEPYQYVTQATGQEAHEIAGKGISTIFFAPIIAALYIITYFLKYFVGIAGSLLDLTLRPELYSNITTSEMVRIGWTIVRDVCNLFFLLALLFIAFCTILRIEKYHAKKTLLMLIIMALLINFSKPIAVFIFDGSQLLMNFFLSKMPQGNQSASTMYNSANKIAELIYGNIQSYLGSDMGIGLATQYLFATVFLFMLLVAYVIIAIFLIIRIVAIMILIIVSPFAFFASVIPDFNKLSSSWWDALFKYSYFGPAAAFFLYLATGFSQYLPKLTENAGTSASLDVLIKNIIHYVVVLVFLYASIIMANKFSLQFSQAVTGYADRALKWGIGMASGYRAARWGAQKGWAGAKYATKAGLRKFDRDVLKSWSPRTFLKGWQQVAEEAEKRHLEPGAAKWAGSLDRMFGTKKPEQFYENRELEERIAKKDKEQESISTQDSAYFGILDKFKGDHSEEAQAQTLMALRGLFKNNDQNELMKRYILNNPEYLKEIEGKLGRKLDSNNPEDLKEAVKFVLSRVGIDEKTDKNQLGRQLHQLSNIALAKGNLSNYGMGIWDQKLNDGRGGFRETNMDEQIAMARGKARNIDAQQKMKMLHWNTLFNEGEIEYDASGNVVYEKDNLGNIVIDDETGRPKVKMKIVGKLHNSGKALLANMTQAEIKQLNRARPDLIQNAYAERNQILEFSKTLARQAASETDVAKASELRQQAINIRAFHDGVIEQFESKAGKEALPETKPPMPAGYENVEYPKDAGF